jgi:hypothetical protein
LLGVISRQAAIHEQIDRTGVRIMSDDNVEKLLAILGQTVASVLTEAKLEVFASAPDSRKRQAVSQRELDERIVNLRDVGGETSQEYRCVMPTAFLN